MLICLMFMIMCSVFVNINFANAETTSQTYVVTANHATLFEEADFASTQLLQLNNGEQVEVEFTDNSPTEYANGEYIFYKIVNFQSLTGYIYADLLTPNGEVITAIPEFNGKTNAKCTVYFLENNSLIESEITLEKGTRIFLYEGFNNTFKYDNEEYNAIAFVNENKVVYGYIQKDFVDPDGINPIIITCVIIIIALLGIIFAWLFIKNKKVKIKKQK